MDCTDAQSLILALDLNETHRRDLPQALGHIEGCETCRLKIADYDRIRDVLAPADEPIEPADGWSAFNERLAKTAAPKPARLRLMPAALAACVALAVVGWSLHLRDARLASSDSGVRHVGAGAVLLPPTEQELTDRTRLFDQVSQVFDGQADWILLADHGSDMGVGNRPAAKDKSLLLIRINISRDGAPFANADVIVVPGQIARSTMPVRGGMQMKYEVATSESDTGHLRIAAEIQHANHAVRRVGTLGGDLRIRMGQIGSLGQVVTTEGTFEFNVGLYRAASAGQRS